MSDHSDFEDDSTELEQDFAAAAKHLERLAGKLDQATLLGFYGLYKQATVGPCTTPKPGLFAMAAKAKWHAWNDVRSLAGDVAMQRYVERLTALRPDWRAGIGGEVGATGTKSHWAAVSRLSLEEYGDKPLAEADKTCVDYVKEGNWQRCSMLVPTLPPAQLDALDADGLALLHWAADRGCTQVLDVVLAAGADVNGRDADGQTALHYACSVGHADCVGRLLKAGANRELVDGGGETAAEVAASGEIRMMVENFVAAR